MRRAYRALAGTVTLGGIAAVSYRATKTIMNHVQSRNSWDCSSAAYKHIDKFSGNCEITADTVKYSDRLAEHNAEIIETASLDGIRLRGHLLTNESPKRIILAMHGWRSTWTKDFGMISAFLENEGCTVLYAEERAHGFSGGNYIGLGLLERHDVHCWINWLTERFGCNIPIYLYGVSMGATAVLMSAEAALPENVCGIIADSAYTSPYDQLKHILKDELKIEYLIRMHLANSICEKNIGESLDSHSTIEAMETNTVPVLLIHGSNDKLVPIEMMYKNYITCIAPKEYLAIEGAAHGMNYMTDRTAYEETLKRFWKQCEDAL
ncbi:MAG: alpha/beta hydrolase [Ruminococcus sp.]|nr:alpha/beta hydrolase [Ruminococcus sp.]